MQGKRQNMNMPLYSYLQNAWPVNRLEATMFSYKPSCFSHVNDYVYRLITLRIT